MEIRQVLPMIDLYVDDLSNCILGQPVLDAEQSRVKTHLITNHASRVVICGYSLEDLEVFEIGHYRFFDKSGHTCRQRLLQYAKMFATWITDKRRRWPHRDCLIKTIALNDIIFRLNTSIGDHLTRFVQQRRSAMYANRDNFDFPPQKCTDISQMPLPNGA